MPIDWVILAGFGLAAMAAASTGAVYKPGRWYEGLSKPGWTPPNWLFPLAWLVLYILIVISAWRVATALAAGAFAAETAALAAAGLAFWAAQMTLNALWSPLFFGIRRPGAALVCLVFMWLAILGTILCFAQVDGVAAAILVPYLIWTSYAGALNVSILRRNGAENWGLPGAA